ncbi:MAG: CDC27 family protein [Pyrinomonadaceae bacterium]|nr:CDC27 family protein [Pyrinomonadaceae bacterium]
MQLKSKSIHLIDSTFNEEVRIRCKHAKKLEVAGKYDEARAALGNLWQGMGERPETTGMDRQAAGELLLCVGVLTGWIGSTRQTPNAQERAKDLISESLAIFESLSERVKTAEAQTELAYCYWRQGGLDEARVLLREALCRLTDEDCHLKAVALIRSAAIEKVATRYHDALRILNEAAPVVAASSSDTLKGRFHNELATVLKDLGTSECRQDYIDRALIEYAGASLHFQQAGHQQYLACVENNLGFLYLMLGNYDKAHEHLNRARHVLVALNDYVHAAQVDETTARALLAEGHNAEALELTRSAIDTLEGGGEHQLLAEALTTHGTALARLRRHNEARVTLHRATFVAEQAGDLEGAGHALLTLIEELSDLIPKSDLTDLYLQASELLAQSQYPKTRTRLSECAAHLRGLIRNNEDAEVADFRAPSTWDNFHFWIEIRRYEGYLIQRALKDAGGMVTAAAHLLGFPHHHSVNALLNGRHRELLCLRTPIAPRKPSKFLRWKAGKSAQS